MKMFQSNIYYFMGIKVYIVSIEKLWSSIFVYGILSLSMEFYVCLWVLPLSMGFYLCVWSSIFVYGVLSLYMEFYLCLWSSIFVYGVLSLSMARLGAKYAEAGCKSMESFGCMSMPFGCMFMDRLGACLTVGSLPDSR